MEARVARLEDQFARIEALLASLGDRMRHVELDVAEIKGRVAMLPSTWQMLTAIIGGQMALGPVFFAALRMFRLGCAL